MKKIAVFGSAFNPPTLGHKSIIDSLDHFDLILLVPSISHAWGKTMLDYEQRNRLVDQFIQDIDSCKVQRSDVEEALYTPENSVTTYAVLTRLQALYPEDELTFVIGPDNLLNFAKFYKADEILQRWTVMACPERLPIRSTAIRDSLQNGQSITGMTTSGVELILYQHQLYLNSKQ
ncbi:nicotinate-nicotinamide nucleotide adenylyltransferase [Vibrio mimicus]|uniref:nicotinate-nicotinamide nucleotide adenylyltransferase n=1 Tax=Vibrio mimicus TaxID=674 RepID=UPI00076B747E|nr:nicotinate-nicotinamide nucleotide adenylyltransferase [Vibrio mimicus]AMG01966.1 nicotinate-nicotinamide nucleotide adenylyltransferase [Vibrio mimicus]KAA3493237.1 nicotinate-nicotinamide nucleotide adenylyltransferase [Vibrio mimicus]